ASPEQSGQLGSKLAVARNEIVRNLRRPGESGNLVIEHERPSTSTIGQGTKDGFGCTINFTIARNENDRALELTCRDLRKLRCNFLRRLVLNCVFSFLPPTLNPPPAEMTITIEDH